VNFLQESNRVILDTVKDMLEGGRVEDAARVISGLHSADAAEVLDALSVEEGAEILAMVEPPIAARALLEMDERRQVEVAERLRTSTLAEVIGRMPVDEAVDLLGDVPHQKRQQILKAFGYEEAGEIEELLVYPDDTAGGLMTTDFVSVSPRMTAEEVIEYLRSVPEEVETIYYVYVVGEDDRLEGVLSLRELIISPPERRVESMMKTDPISVRPLSDQQEVAKIIERYDLLAVPVTDDDGRMLGIVTVDDVLDVIGKEATEDIGKFAGATGVEETPGRLLSNLGRRLPWFFLALVIEILVAGGILKLYSPIFEKFVVLIFFIPLLVTMGGNVAVQSSTVVRYFLEQDRVSARASLKTVFSEILWGVLVAAAAGGMVTALSFLLNFGASVGLVVGIALSLSVIAASVVGCAFPIFARAIRRDPGAISGPLLGTTMDVLSLAIYLFVGRLLI